MKKPYTEPGANDEPIGIIISSGARSAPAPAFFAYIWGDIPDAASDSVSSSKAA